MKRFLYERLIKSLLIEISRAEYAEEARFLSNRNICRLWGIAQRTVDRSIDYLKEQGILRSFDRSGYRLLPGARHRAMFLSRYCDEEPLPKVGHQRASLEEALPSDSKRRRCALIIEADRSWVEWRADRGEASFHSPMPPISDAVPDLCDGFLSAARQRGHHVDIVMIPDHEDSRHFLHSCIDKAHWNGVAFFRRTTDSRPLEAIRLIKEAAIPHITIMEPCGDRNAPCVEVNNFALGCEAANAMVSSGAERFILLDIPAETYTRNPRIKGALYALDAHGLMERCIVYRMSHREEEPIPTDFEALLAASRTTPSGLFVLYNQLFEKVSPVIGRLGLRIPEQLSIVNCGIPIVLPDRDLKLSFVEIDFYEIGSTAYHSLNELLEGRLMRKYTIVEPTFRLGDSTHA